MLAADEAALHEAAEILLKKAELVPGVSAALPVSALDSTPEAVRSRAVQIAIAAVAGREKDIGYLHVHSVLELERGQVSLPYGVIAVREGETLRLLRQAGAPGVTAHSAGADCFLRPWRVRIAADTDEGLPLSVPPGAALSVTGWGGAGPAERKNAQEALRGPGNFPDGAGCFAGAAGERTGRGGPRI